MRTTAPHSGRKRAGAGRCSSFGGGARARPRHAALRPPPTPPGGVDGRRRLPAPPRSSGAESQHVPSDSFGGRSPERVAADALRSLFTFAAGKIVLAQLEGSGRGGLAAYDRAAYDALAAAMQAWPRPLATGGGGGGTAALPEDDRPPARGAAAADAWLAGLARAHPAVARRVMEVRHEYAARDFEWSSTERLSVQGLANANVALMKELAYSSLKLSEE